MKFIKKISLVMAFIVTAVISFVLGAFTIVGLQYAWNAMAQADVKITRDIDLRKDHFFANDPDLLKIEGVIKKGSIGQQSFRKGSAVYLNFPIVVSAEKVEYLKY